jgi:hypothetical protein
MQKMASIAEQVVIAASSAPENTTGAILWPERARIAGVFG